MTVFQVDFEPVGRRATIEEGKTLLEAAQSAGVGLVAPCGGKGNCGRCKIKLQSGTMNTPSKDEEAFLTSEELAEGWRLGCRSIPRSDVKVILPPESLTTTQRLQVEGQDLAISLNPAVHILDLELKAPDLQDLVSDTSRIRQAAAREGSKTLSFDSPVLEILSLLLRQNNWKVRLAVWEEQVIAAFPPGTALLGLAVDIGTTKVAAYLVDLETGETLAKAGAMNPQIGYGEDVVSRISYCNENINGREELQTRLIETLNTKTADLCRQAHVSRDQIVDSVFVGNTAMHHLFAGFPVRQLGESPYIAAVSEAVNLLARDLGLNLNSGARVYLPPNIAGFVGADHVSMVLASEIWKAEDRVLALDIGTNTEITLASAGKLFCCSTASGPAFEGAHIRDGMRAAPGAVEKIQFTGGDFCYQTIEGKKAVGICGSGILDAAAALLEAGLISRTGRFEKTHSRVQGDGKDKAFLLVAAEDTGHGRDIRVTRSDINEIQLAKGAIRAGTILLLQAAGMEIEDVDRVIIAGAFGTYLDIQSAIDIGMFLDLPAARFFQIGNAAGIGAKQMLLSTGRRREAETIANREDYIELSMHPGFTEAYMKAIYF
ncbi:MAG: DUF4445 domain-containing protein [Anaerolineales bacterium]|nr:DUF4445 domain-containing protein [Anaerolineales bacterium]